MGRSSVHQLVDLEASPSDFFEDHCGRAKPYSQKSPIPRALDVIFDARLAASAELRRIEQAAGGAASQKVLIVGVEVPSRAGRLSAITQRMARSRHEVDVSTILMKPQGKFANVDEAILAAPRPLHAYDWLVIADDDVAFADGFLDRYLALASATELFISQPAHKFASYASFQISRRVFGSLVRRSRFVEIGPITVLRAPVFAEIVPFPASRWCYGIDVLWSELAKRHDWGMGIVDGAPIRHLSPVARSYDPQAAFEEGRALFSQYGVTVRRAEALTTRPLLEA